MIASGTANTAGLSKFLALAIVEEIVAQRQVCTLNLSACGCRALKVLSRQTSKLLSVSIGSVGISCLPTGRRTCLSCPLAVAVMHHSNPRWEREVAKGAHAGWQPRTHQRGVLAEKDGRRSFLHGEAETAMRDTGLPLELVGAVVQEGLVR